MRPALILFLFFQSVVVFAQDNKLKSVFELVMAREYDSAYEKVREVVGYNEKINYVDAHGNELTETKSSILELIQQIEKIDKKCKRFLSEGEVKNLKSEAEKCQGSVANNQQDEDSELEVSCTSYRSKQSDVHKCNEAGELGKLLNRIKKYSDVNFDNFMVAYKAKLQEIDSHKKTIDDQLKQTLLKKEVEENIKSATDAKMKATPEYKKCQYMSRIVSDKKMLGMWTKNIEEIKQDAKAAGTMTVKMQHDMDNSLGFVRTYKFKVSENEKQLKSYSKISIDESQCKKLISSFGASEADRYGE